MVPPLSCVAVELPPIVLCCRGGLTLVASADLALVVDSIPGNNKQGESSIVQLFQIPNILFHQYCVVCLYNVYVCVICNIPATVFSATFPPLSEVLLVCL